MINLSFQNKYNLGSKKNDIKVSKFVCIYFILRTVNTTFSTAIIFPEQVKLFILAVLAIILFFQLFKTLSVVLQYKLFPFVLAEMIALTAYLISLFMNSSLMTEIFSRMFWTVCVCIPLGICVYAINDKFILYHMFLKSCFIITVLLTIMLLFKPNEQVYMMNFSNAMLYPCLFSFNEFIHRKRIRHFLFAIYGVITILLFGSRGALICIAVFFCIKTIIKTHSPVYKTLIISCFMGLYAFAEKLLGWILGIVINIGLTSRSINLLMNNITYDSGRSKLWEDSKKMVSDRWLFGWGITGELNRLENYPHSIFWEILIDFGVIIGGVILLILSCLIIKGLIKKEAYTLSLCVIFLSIAIRLFVSGTYLTSEPLFVFVFLALSASSSKISIHTLIQRKAVLPLSKHIT